MRPHGRLFGTLVHQVLRDVDFDSSAAVLERIAQGCGARIGSSQEEIDAAVIVVQSILRHPVVSAAGRSGTACREYPFIYRDDDGKIVEGNIDLVYQQAEEWIVVDFKTGPSDRVEYRRQVVIYVRASRPKAVRALLFEVQ
jgi:ATP-dependent helicase/nuclease subunit A